MARSRTFWSSLAFGLILAALLGGCGGGSSTASVPATATIFYAHSLAFRNTTTFAWGYNGFGQLGVAPSGDPVSTPRAVPGLSGVSGFSAGADHSLAFTNNSTVRAWGYNGFGQLGATIPNNQTYSATPVKVGTISGITSVSAGGHHSLAIGKEGIVWAWGYNASGQLGDRTNTNQTRPVQVVLGSGGAPLTSITKIAAGGSHSLALKEETVNGVVVQTLYAWGDNSYGQVGFPKSQFTQINQATEVILLNNTARILAIAAGGAFSLALTDDNKVWAWGYNGLGQLGLDPVATPFLEVPTPVNGVTGGNITGQVTAIAAGLDHSLALVGNTLRAWGYNGFGQLGNNGTATMSFDPVTVVNPSGANFTQIISVTGHHNLARAVDAQGTSHLYAWGDNGYGQIGDGTTTNRSVPTPVTGF